MHFYQPSLLAWIALTLPQVYACGSTTLTNATGYDIPVGGTVTKCVPWGLESLYDDPSIPQKATIDVIIQHCDAQCISDAGCSSYVLFYQKNKWRAQYFTESLPPPSSCWSVTPPTQMIGRNKNSQEPCLRLNPQQAAPYCSSYLGKSAPATQYSKTITPAATTTTFTTLVTKTVCADALGRVAGRRRNMRERLEAYAPPALTTPPAKLQLKPRGDPVSAPSCIDPPFLAAADISAACSCIADISAITIPGSTILPASTVTKSVTSTTKIAGQAYQTFSVSAFPVDQTGNISSTGYPLRAQLGLDWILQYKTSGGNSPPAVNMALNLGQLYVTSTSNSLFPLIYGIDTTPFGDGQQALGLYLLPDVFPTDLTSCNINPTTQQLSCVDAKGSPLYFQQAPLAGGTNKQFMMSLTSQSSAENVRLFASAVRSISIGCAASNLIKRDFSHILRGK